MKFSKLFCSFVVVIVILANQFVKAQDEELADAIIIKIIKASYNDPTDRSQPPYLLDIRQVGEEKELFKEFTPKNPDCKIIEWTFDGKIYKGGTDQPPLLGPVTS